MVTCDVYHAGLPTIVARSAMMDAKIETVKLPLVAKKVHTAKAALSASNSEGADFILLAPIEDEDPMDIMISLSENIKVPIFIAWSLTRVEQKLFGSGVGGFFVSLKDIGQVSEGQMSSLVRGTVMKNSETGNGNEGARNVEIRQSNNGSYLKDKPVGFLFEEGSEKKFIEKEKVVLLEAIDVIKEAAPMVIF